MTILQSVISCRQAGPKIQERRFDRKLEHHHWKPAGYSVCSSLLLQGCGAGYESLYVEHVLQADRGADFDFLVGCRGSEIPRERH